MIIEDYYNIISCYNQAIILFPPTLVAGTVTDISVPRNYVVSWAPPNPLQGIILHYNIRITQSDTGKLVELILEFNSTSLDMSSHVESDGIYKVEVCV